MDIGQATDVLWYYLNNSSYFTMADTLAWPAERITSWLDGTLASALLGDAGEGAHF
jgi:hypothetical protein